MAPVGRARIRNIPRNRATDARTRVYARVGGLERSMRKITGIRQPQAAYLIEAEPRAARPGESIPIPLGRLPANVHRMNKGAAISGDPPPSPPAGAARRSLGWG